MFFYKKNILLLLSVCPIFTLAQTDRLINDLEYSIETNAIVSSGDVAPFWFSANKFGLSSIRPQSAYLRTSIGRITEADSNRIWRIGYKADLVAPIDYTSKFIVQQLYANVEYKHFLLTIGAKEIPTEFKNQELSTGGATLSNNARPIPMVRLEIPDFWQINNWLGIKGHIAYGWYTDNGWQKDFIANTSNVYSANSKFHSKAGFIKIGNENKFPITVIAGLQMATQFGGEAWNLQKRNDDNSEGDLSHYTFSNTIKSYLNAFIPAGSDPNDGDYSNVEGNHLGSWHLYLNYYGKDWGLKAYAEHFFEDHSQMFMQYDWNDILIGAELNLPKNPVVSTLLFEHLFTQDQTGGIYHDATDNLPVQISGSDEYYNHHVYGGWQHWGQAMGNPLLLSPIYNNNHRIYFYHNRIKAYHYGISGNPTDELQYKLMYSYLTSLGTYFNPTINPMKQYYFLAELGYNPKWSKGWCVKVGLGLNKGDLIDNSTGFSFTIKKAGLLR